MALQNNGQISLNDLHIEVGGSSGTECSFNDSDVRGLIGRGAAAQMGMNEWYGAANEVTLTSAGTVNGQAQRQQISASSFVSSGGTLIIPSNIWIWSNSTGTAALTINVPCTIKNYGKIIGKGGNGGSFGGGGGGGGPAIRINSGVSGVTIINYSGAFIAGGGGGGSGHAYRGGGGGGGGGTGGRASVSSNSYGGGGGALNANGGNASAYAGLYGVGGNDTSPGGGVAGVSVANDGSIRYGAAGGGGSRRLSASANSQRPNGGGGAWGGAGSRSFNQGSAGGGGKAIDDSGVSYSLSNSGKIYGGT